ncbi:MAG: adenylosuccinate lyase [Leptonema sp. (in: Bacteria)]|nr:adenylosuccinate lyase [Leptonema sp. (in: bacteria)]
MIDRYSLPELDSLWSLENKFKIWLEVEIAVCEAWSKRGVIPADDMAQIRSKANFDLNRIEEIEKEVHHDVIAFLTSVKEHIGPAGRWVHYGMTSSDVGDTALCIQMSRAADVLLTRLRKVIDVSAELAKRYKNQIMVGRTHGIHGEPTTLGLKFAHFYAEMKRNEARLIEARNQVAVGKLSGAVGTFSNIEPEIEEEVCKALNLAPESIATQVINRDRHAHFVSVLGIIAGGLDRMAQEIRLLQKSEGREVEEPFAKGQKGSSAMPHKRNPVICERICGLARVIQSNVMTAYRDMPLWHERDISHSSAERVILPDTTIALDYILDKMHYVLSGLHVYPDNMQRVMNLTRGLIFSQRLMLNLIERGLEREEAYRRVQTASMQVWADINSNLKQKALTESEFTELLSPADVEEIFDVTYYVRNIDSIYQRLALQ